MQPASTQRGHWHIHSLTLQFLVFSQSLVDLQVCSGPLSRTRVQLCFKLVFFFFWLGGVVYRFSPMFLKSPLIHSRIHYRFYAAHLIKSSNKASPRHDASSQHRRTLFQKSWSSSPGQAGLRVSASLSLLPWDTATLVIQESTPTATVQQTPAAGSLMTFERSWSLLVTSLCCWGGLAWMARPQRVSSSFERPLLAVYFPDTRTVDFKFFWDRFKSLTTMISRFNLVSNCLRSHTSVWFHPF